MTIEKVAQVAHEINKAYCLAIGDTSQPSWEEAPDWQKQSAINGVIFHLANPGSTPEQSHESWLKQKEADGWKYGEVKNPETKEHPCFRPYAELPADQRAKDYLFKATVESLRSEVKSSTTMTRGQEVMTVSFNIGQREDIAEIKQICADAYDVIDKHVAKAYEANRAKMEGGYEDIALKVKGNDIGRLAAIAKTNLETAQMYAVKAVTR